MQILREKVKKLTDEHVAIGKAEAELQAASVAKLGDGDFVGHVLASAEEAMEKRYALRTGGFDLGESRLQGIEGQRWPFMLRYPFDRLTILSSAEGLSMNGSGQEIVKLFLRKP
jgi:hypothetical protein